MNVVVTRGATTAAEGFPRRAFSVDDVQRMIDAGVIGEDEKFELIEGEIVVMAAKHVGHDRIKHKLNAILSRHAPEGVFVAIEGTLQLAKDILVEPDIAIISQSMFDVDPKTFAQPRAGDVRLLIEVAASSLKYDRGVKARLYARHGIQEFWIIDANVQVTWVHTGPSGDGWSSIVEYGPKDTLTTPALPGFSLRLGDLG
jgi:Uma2 family endonuclease